MVILMKCKDSAIQSAALCRTLHASPCQGRRIFAEKIEAFRRFKDCVIANSSVSALRQKRTFSVADKRAEKHHRSLPRLGGWRNPAGKKGPFGFKDG